MIDKDAILARSCNAARIAVADWAFAAGIVQGVREARVTSEET
jgi:hypothetical protein